MRALITTLRAPLEAADALFELGRIKGALEAYESLVSQAQERSDRPTEVSARAMLSRVLLRRNDLEGARAQIAMAERVADPDHVDAFGRLYAARARLAPADLGEDAARELLEQYLHWAEDRGAWEWAVDAAGLLGDAAQGQERISWLQKAVELATMHAVDPAAARVYTNLAAALDLADRPEEALDAYRGALAVRRRVGTQRDRAAACWAVGASAWRLEEIAEARSCLEEAVTIATGSDGCADVLALALTDLARLAEAAGDVVEARRLILRALAHAREEDLARFAPSQWDQVVQVARRLELDA